MMAGTENTIAGTAARIVGLAEKLRSEHSLTKEEYRELVEGYSEQTASVLADMAVEQRQPVYGNRVYTRGLIEFTNICRNDCLYCGIRKSNRDLERYRLSKEEILECCREGRQLGFRTFVLQGGEDSYYTDAVLCDIVRSIRQEFPDCAITLSVGERSRESYEALKQAGADRYLLRHETATETHYGKLHPASMHWQERMQCLRELKKAGYQVGCGFMVGSPFQTAEELAADLKFIEEFRPDMCGIGPFIPHEKTPFAAYPAGDAGLTCYLLSILRLMDPELLLPATTALGTLDPEGREKGILAGANVVMPNLSPLRFRKQYTLYDNKICTGEESAQSVDLLAQRMKKIGAELVSQRGDVRHRSL